MGAAWTLLASPPPPPAAVQAAGVAAHQQALPSERALHAQSRRAWLEGSKAGWSQKFKKGEFQKLRMRYLNEVREGGAPCRAQERLGGQLHQTSNFRERRISFCVLEKCGSSFFGWLSEQMSTCC